MANPTSVSGRNPAVLLAGTTQESVTLKEIITYTLSHDGEDDSGVAQTSTVYLAFGDDVTATPAEGENKLKLRNGMTVEINKTTTLNFKVASGANPVTFSIIPAVP
jgi:hypothetical protein